MKIHNNHNKPTIIRQVFVSVEMFVISMYHKNFYVRPFSYMCIFIIDKLPSYVCDNEQFRIAKDVPPKFLNNIEAIEPNYTPDNKIVLCHIRCFETYFEAIANSTCNFNNLHFFNENRVHLIDLPATYSQ